MTLGELQGRCPDTNTHIFVLSHPAGDSHPADGDAGVEPLHRIAAITVTTLFCPASISVMRGSMGSEKLS